VLFRLPFFGFMIPIANDPRMTDLTREQRYRLAILDTFDMLAPQHDHPMTWQEMEGELRAAGAERWEFRSRVPVVVSGISSC
jgi:hypothetical protein